MFERCAPSTRLIIEGAVEEARARRHKWLGTEHLLVALSRRRDLLPGDVAAMLPDADVLAAALNAEIGPGRADAELLKAVGVDLDQVRSAVRRTFGEEAVRRLGRPVRQPWQPWRRPSRRCTSMLAGELSLAPRVKQSLERARRTVEGPQRALVEPAALLLGMLEVEDTMAARMLTRLGVDLAQLAALARSPLA